VIVIAACLPILARHVGVPTDRALWLVLACPLVIVDLIGGAHNDALTVGLMLAGLAVLSTRSNRLSGLIIGGVLIGLSISVKTTIGAMLPFAVLFAAGGPQLPALGVLFRKAVAVIGAALVTLLGLSYASGLGMTGWITALRHAGDSVIWTSPPTAVGLASGYTARLFGAHIDIVNQCRLVALIAMPFVLLLILWHSRNHNPLYGAGLALLATIFLAPVVQVWYLVWPLALFAATKVRIRWFLAAIAFGSCIVLPDGSGMTKFLQMPMSFVMTGIVIWTIIRGFSWLRGFEPKEIDFEAAMPKPMPVDSGGAGEVPEPVGAAAGAHVGLANAGGRGTSAVAGRAHPHDGSGTTPDANPPADGAGPSHDRDRSRDARPSPSASWPTRMSLSNGASSSSGVASSRGVTLSNIAGWSSGTVIGPNGAVVGSNGAGVPSGSNGADSTHGGNANGADVAGGDAITPLSTRSSAPAERPNA